MDDLDRTPPSPRAQLKARFAAHRAASNERQAEPSKDTAPARDERPSQRGTERATGRTTGHDRDRGLGD